MEFGEKYISAAENIAKPDKEKIALSNDAFAIGEIIAELIKKIEQARVCLMK